MYRPDAERTWLIENNKVISRTTFTNGKAEVDTKFTIDEDLNNTLAKFEQEIDKELLKYQAAVSALTTEKAALTAVKQQL